LVPQLALLAQEFPFCLELVVAQLALVFEEVLEGVLVEEELVLVPVLRVVETWMVTVSGRGRV